MFLDVDHHEQISGRPSVRTGLTFAADAKPRSGLDTGGYLDLQALLSFNTALAPALLAWVANDLALAGAVWARPHYAEKALLILRLSAAAAGYAGFGDRSRFGTAPVTNIALFKPRDPELFVLAVGGIFERYLKIVAKVGTSLHGRSSRTAAAEHIAEAKKIEYILDICKTRVESAAAHSRMPETVIRSALLRIGQDRIGFGAFLEFFLGMRVIGILVRMVLYRKCPVGPFYF
jgi:hypothetical protein